MLLIWHTRPPFVKAFVPLSELSQGPGAGTFAGPGLDAVLGLVLLPFGLGVGHNVPDAGNHDNKRQGKGCSTSGNNQCDTGHKEYLARHISRHPTGLSVLRCVEVPRPSSPNANKLTLVHVFCFSHALSMARFEGFVKHLVTLS